MEPKMYIGASYYPEQWQRQRWPEDLRLMNEAGINVLRRSRHERLGCIGCESVVLNWGNNIISGYTRQLPI